MPAFMMGGAKGIEPFVKKFQDGMMRVKYSGRAGGGRGIGHRARRRLRADAAFAPSAWRALESYIGLVEVGVGLVPAGGGLKEAALARRARRERRSAQHQLPASS